MNIVSRAEFSRQVHVARSSITHMVKVGRLPSVDGNIDLDDPEVQKYVEAQRGALKGSGNNGTGRPVYRKKRVEPPHVYTDDDFTEEEKKEISGLIGERSRGVSSLEKQQQSEYDDTIQQIKKAELVNRQFKNAKEKIFYEELTKKIVVFEAAARSFNILMNAIKQNFGLFDQQHTDQIYDAVSAGKSRIDVMTMIRGLIETKLRESQTAAERAIEKLREA